MAPTLKYCFDDFVTIVVSCVGLEDIGLHDD